MTVSRLEKELSGQTEFAKYAAFLSMWPMGEDAMDLRFQLLTKTIDDMGKTLEYAIYKAGRCTPQSPRFKKFEDFKIFERMGSTGGPKKFTELSAEEVDKRMRAFVVAHEAKWCR
jgi:hypothetical protein